MILRTLKWAGLAIVLLVAATFAAQYWLLQTSMGSRWLWHRVTALVPGDLGARTVDGSLTGGLRLTGVAFRNPSLEVALSKVELALELDLFPLAVNVSTLHADDVGIRMVDRPPPEEPSAGFRPESLVLPVPINMKDVRVRNLKVTDGKGEQIVAVNNAELAGGWHEAISLSRIRLESSIVRADGTATLGLVAPYEAGLSIAARYPLQTDADTRIPIHVIARAEGDLERLEVDITSDEPQLRATGTLSRLLQGPGWDVRLQSPYLQWPLTGPPPRVSLRDVRLQTRGQPGNYSVFGDGLVTVAEVDQARFSLDAGGDTEGLEVANLELDGRMLDAAASGELRWAGGMAITADADIGRFDPAVLTAEWPAGKPVTGTLQAAWSADQVRVTNARLRVTGTDQAVDATGLIDLERGVVDADLDWRNLRWPIDARNADYRSEFGRINVAGKPESWTLDGSIAFAAANLPQGVFQLSGQGTNDDLAVTLRESKVLGGTVAGLVTWRWRDQGFWSARLAADNIDVGALAPAWPGRISTEFTASGQQAPLGVHVAIDRLEGVIRGRQVEGQGGFRYANGNLSAEQLDIVSGNSRLRANGGLQRDDGLDFSLQVDSLADFHPAAAGALEAAGNISLASEFPVLRMNLQAQDLAWRDYRVEELTVASHEMKSTAGVELDGDGQGLTLGERRIEAFSFQLTASETRQQVEVQASMDGKQAGVALDGRLDNWREPFASTWSGKLQAATVEAPGSIKLALEEPADLRFATDRVSLQRACLAGEGGSRICLGGNWTQAANFDLSADLVAVPVDLVRLLIDTELEFTQTLDGSISVNQATGRQLSAHARVDIAPGQIRNPLDRRIALRTRTGVFSMDLDDGQLLSGRLTLPFASAAEIDARFGLVDVGKGANSGVNGELTVTLHNLGVVSTIVPSIDAAGGQLDVDLALTGTLAEPQFSGTTSLRNGRLAYSPLGLKLSDIQLQGRIHEDNRIDLRSTFKAGTGSGEIVSSTDSIGGIGDGVALSLTGTNLTIIDLPDINVVADMDLDLDLRSDELEINGDILIPKARLSPANITSARVSESEDVVIVASEHAEDELQNGKKAPYAMAGKVDLSLGKDVVIDLGAAEARVSGSTAFVWNGPPMPTANGEYKVAGKFEAYGQLLEITEGSVRFAGVPADNPVLRIRAEREIFGNPRIRNAGVLVSGTAKNPQFEVYSNPPTNNERALTLLVTGSDFNYEQGVGAVDVGTYIAPDLYISYGIGLFDRENVISLRYDLTKGFGIKATSGKRAEGVDLSYTIER
ncbi:MAG: translocation/assembly module TamB domain-containing protein [Woeseiaceae bacterium]